jgi:hypothetical protein
MEDNRIKQISLRIKEIKKLLVGIGELRPGSLTQQFHNADQKKVYWSLSYTHKMKSRSEYIKPDLVETTQRQIQNYKLLKSLMEEWIALSIEQAKLNIQIARNKG